MTVIEHRRSVLLLALLLALAGCKKEKANPPAAGASPANDGPSKADIRAGVGKMLPSVQRDTAGMDLRNIAQLYATSLLTGTSPKKIEDFRDLDPRTVQAVKNGEYVVLWNANPNAPTNAIVAYEKEVPTRGGMVASLSGTVTRMTTAEFQAAPKASGQ
jgi:hypothetical protein